MNAVQDTFPLERRRPLWTSQHLEHVSFFHVYKERAWSAQCRPDQLNVGLLNFIMLLSKCKTVTALAEDYLFALISYLSARSSGSSKFKPLLPASSVRTCRHHPAWPSPQIFRPYNDIGCALYGPCKQDDSLQLWHNRRKEVSQSWNSTMRLVPFIVAAQLWDNSLSSVVSRTNRDLLLK